MYNCNLCYKTRFAPADLRKGWNQLQYMLEQGVLKKHPEFNWRVLVGGAHMSRNWLSTLPPKAQSDPPRKGRPVGKGSSCLAQSRHQGLQAAHRNSRAPPKSLYHHLLCQLWLISLSVRWLIMYFHKGACGKYNLSGFGEPREFSGKGEHVLRMGMNHFGITRGDMPGSGMVDMGDSILKISYHTNGLGFLIAMCEPREFLR